MVSVNFPFRTNITYFNGTELFFTELNANKANQKCKVCTDLERRAFRMSEVRLCSDDFLRKRRSVQD